MAEHKLEHAVLGVAWDGTGYGSDKTIWGGEFLAINGHSFERVAHFQRFQLPGGEHEVRFGDRDRGAESVTHLRFVEPLACEHRCPSRSSR